ncbi:hypothetical protein HIM_05081 [Hirsutella minnesotensis 3608]|uniref:Proteasome assembly chaperone 3 n=1 Tax=Hirsutella minnesotensis 3608 TaxID=1043627 RepID=A0A0F7ZUX4_9HYPO|nr:hypothetical protein HIM_05081 [Hirsutella minnesotensis 3608]
MAETTENLTQLSIPLPHSLDTRIYLRLSTQAKAVLLCLTTASQDDVATPRAMGSFVYALPNRFDAQQPLATTLFPHEPTLEFTTRLAKLIARRTQLPAYVTNSISFADAGMGGDVEEEMEAFRNIVQVVVDRLGASRASPGTATANGKP